MVLLLFILIGCRKIYKSTLLIEVGRFSEEVFRILALFWKCLHALRGIWIVSEVVSDDKQKLLPFIATTLKYRIYVRYYGETWPRSFPSSTRAFKTVMGLNLWPAAPQAGTLAKSYLNSLHCLLFETSTILFYEHWNLILWDYVFKTTFVLASFS